MQLGCKYMVETATALKDKKASSPQDPPSPDAGASGQKGSENEFYGRVITIASQAGRSVSKLGGAHYTASKAAAIGELIVRLSGKLYIC